MLFKGILIKMGRKTPNHLLATALTYFIINIPVLYTSFLLSEMIKINPSYHSKLFLFSVLQIFYPLMVVVFLIFFPSLSEFFKIKKLLIISLSLAFSPLILSFFKIYIPLSLCSSFFTVILSLSIAAYFLFFRNGRENNKPDKSFYLSCILLLISEGCLFLSNRLFGKIEPSFLVNRLNEIAIIGGVLSISVFLALTFSGKKKDIIYLLRRLFFSRGLIIILLILYVAVPVFIFFTVLDSMPHIQDEISYLFEAKILASGKIYVETPKLPDFFDYEFIVTDGEKWYGKYFPGFSILLAAGLILNCPWLINPLFGAASILLFYLFLKENTDKNTSSLMAFFSAISPFIFFIDSSYLSHTTCLFFLTLFLYSFFKTVNNKTSASSFLEGFALGFAFNIRPLTALTFSAPFLFYGLILLVKKKIKLKNAGIFLIPLVVMLAFFLLYNFMLTGDAFLTPFNKYCPTDKLGFGENIGLPYLEEYGHNFYDGWLNTRANLKELSSDLLGFPKILILITLAPFIFRRAGILEYLFLSSILLNIGGYFCYYFNGIAFGPRYYFETVLMILFLMARGFIILHELTKKLLINVDSFNIKKISELIVPFFLGILILHSLAVFIPDKISFYGNRYWNMDTVLKETIKKSSVHDAVIFVRSGYYRRGEAAPNYYGAGFIENDIELKSDIIYARDFGDEENMKLMKYYKEKKAYRFVYNESLVTANRYYYENTAPFVYPIPKPELQSAGLSLYVQYP